MSPFGLPVFLFSCCVAVSDNASRREFGEHNASARERVARVYKLLLLPYPCLRHLVLGMNEIAALPKMIAKVPRGQLETLEEAKWAVYVAPLLFLPCVMSSAMQIH